MFLLQFPYMEYHYEPTTWDGYWDTLHTKGVVYREMLDETRAVGHNIVPNWAKIVKLCRTFSHMDVLCRLFASWQVGWFDDTSTAAAQPSRTERLRILRAFYRRQIVCNAWVPTKREQRFSHGDVIAFNNATEQDGHRLGLFASFEPWEFQQVDHVDRFLKRLCLAVCNTEKGRSSAMEPSTEKPILVDGSDEDLSDPKFADYYSNPEILVQYMREHPDIANASFLSLPSLQELHKERGYLESYGAPLELRRWGLFCIDRVWQVYQKENLLDPAHVKLLSQGESSGRTDKLKLKFMRDAVDLVPFGWVDALAGQYESLFGEGFVEIRLRVTGDPNVIGPAYRASEMYRDTGFSLWDRSRIECFKTFAEFKRLQTGWVVR